MWLINWWCNRKIRKQKKLEEKAKKELIDVKAAFKQNYLNTHGLNQERDFAFIDRIITLVGDKYLKEVELLLSSTGNGEYLSDKITNEDIPKLVKNIMEALSKQYVYILEIYLGTDDNIMKYIIWRLNENIVKIMLMNRHKINSMNPEYRKLQQALNQKPKEVNNQQR